MNQTEYNQKMLGHLEDVARLAQQQETLRRKLDEVERKIWRLRLDGVDEQHPGE